MIIRLVNTADGCFDKAREAIEAHCEVVAETEKKLPQPRPMTAWRADREVKGWTWGIVDVRIEKHFGPAQKINITVPASTLRRIDEYAQKHGETRSGFLEKAAERVMRS